MRKFACLLWYYLGLSGKNPLRLTHNSLFLLCCLAQTGVEMFKKLLDYGMAGDNIGALLRGLKREDVKRGQILCKPGSVKTAKKFEAEVYALKKDEGGRHTPFMNNYRPQFFFRTADITGSLILKEGTEMVMPGDNTTIDVELIAPLALEPGLRFNMREGGLTVGTGIVTKVTE